MDLERSLQIATKAAYKSADIIRQHFGRIRQVDKKGPIDLVTVADRESEKQIIDTIGSAFPDHGIIAEEGSRHQTEADVIWVVDPLDGTTNFAHGVPIFAVSIAAKSKEGTQLGVVLNPVSGEFFSAVRRRGAQLNGRPLAVSKTTTVSASLLVTGFSYKIAEDTGQAIKRFENCLKASRGIRRLGAAALDLCYLACGRFDAYWEQDLKPWDTAAGALIASEAGAQITTYSGRAFSDDHPEILATNGLIHAEMVALLAL